MNSDEPDMATASTSRGPSPEPGSAPKSGNRGDMPFSLLRFRPFTQESYERQTAQLEEDKKRAAEKAINAQEAHLVDGELKFGDGEDEDEELLPDPNLVEGGTLLPTQYGIFPPSYHGVPLEEIDPAIHDRTFVVINRRIKKKCIYRFSSTSSFFLMSPWSPVRRLAICICTNQLFDYFVVLTILTNCVFLALNQSTVTDMAEYVFLGIYTLEMIVKLIARGFFINSYTYLRDPWNWLDFAVIVVAYSTIIVELAASNYAVGNVTALRTFRVLRALRTFSILPGLKTIVSALFRASRMLLEVTFLTLFFLMVFSLFALQVYKGQMRNKCVQDMNCDALNLTGADCHYYYTEWTKNTSHHYQTDGTYLLCGNTSFAGRCPSGYTCLPNVGENPNFGYTSFDHIGYAMLSCFQLITLDFWEDLYDKVIRMSGPWSVIYFVVVILLGSFYLINLMLAVVALSYEQEAANAGKEKEREKAGQRKSKANPMYDLALLSLKSKQMKDGKGRKGSDAKKQDMRTLHAPQPPKPRLSANWAKVKKATFSPGGLPTAISKTNMDHGSSAKKSSKDGASGSKPATPHKPLADGYSTISDDQKSSAYVIIRAKEENPVPKADTLEDPEHSLPSGNQLVDRNCMCCNTKCCKIYIQWLIVQNFIYTIVSDPFFEIFITLCIVLNTAFLAAEHYDQPTWLDDLLTIVNIMFTVIFSVEAALKIIALSLFYFKNAWNIFDLIIVFASFADLAFTGNGGLTVIRIFRLLRIVKLAQSWSTMRVLLTIIFSTLGALGNLTAVLGVVIYIFAVIGFQLFSTSYTSAKFDDEPVPRWNFTDFAHSLVLIFRVLCGEWIEPLWDCMRVGGNLCMIVFLPTLVIGNFIVLNLFLALLLNAFATDSIRKHTESGAEISRFRVAYARIKRWCCSCCFKSKVEPEEGAENLPASTSAAGGAGLTAAKGGKKPVLNTDKDFANGSAKDSRSAADAFKTVGKRTKFTDFDTARSNVPAIQVKDPDDLELGATASTVNKFDKDGRKGPMVRDCFPLCCTARCNHFEDFDHTKNGMRWHKFRAMLVKFVDHKIFEGFILLVIIASSVTLCFEDIYLEEGSLKADVLKYFDIAFCIIFTIEMVLKWFAYGLRRYFTSFWTILDFVIVAITIASLVGENLNIDNITAFRSLRTLRALRPLRAISRWQGMRIVVNALVRAIPAIGNVLVVGLVFWLIFSIMGVQFFKGTFFKCVDENGEKLSCGVIPNKTACLANNYTWKHSLINFDNVGIGYVALLQVATFEGWMEIMEDAIDSTKVDMQPCFEASFGYYAYFIAFIIFGSFFVLNLFIGVIIDNFNMLKKKYDGSYLDMFLTSSQRNYYNTLKKLGSRKPQKTIKRPKNKFMSYFFDIAMSTKFELAIVILIFLNMVVLSIEHYNMAQSYEEVLSILNIAFVAVFTLEAAVKLIGLRWHYFRLAWNVFDFIIVVLSIIGIILDDILRNVFVTPTMLRVIRVFRIGRVLRLVKAAKGIRKLLFALVISLPALINIGALLLLVMFIYSIIGMVSFGNVKIQHKFDEIVNFQTFFSSFMLMLRLSTAAGWNEILDSLLVRPPDCDENNKLLPNGTYVPSPNGECGIDWLAIPFMYSYIVFVFVIVINMYIAVILENFNQAHQQEEVGITEDDFDMFYVVWERYDPHATQFIKYDQLSDFVADLEEPLGIPRPNEIALVSFNLPIVEGDKLHCLDVLMALVKSVLGEVEETDEFRTLRDQMDEKFKEIFPSRVMTVVKSTTMQRKKEDVAARTLQRAWKRFRTHRALKNITAMAVKQNLSRTESMLHSRSNSIVSLGRRLSQALTNFFVQRDTSYSRPGSAVSTASNTRPAAPITKQNKIVNSLKLPTLSSLYSPRGKNRNASNNLDL